MFGRAFLAALVLACVTGITFYAHPANCQVVTEGLISYWTFNKADIEDDVVKDVWGGQDAKMMAELKTVEGKVGEALEFAGGRDDYLLVTDKIGEAKLPVEAMTAEVWVYPKHFIEWGGYLSCFQDNGEVEEGWTLGTNNQVSFAISTEGGNRDGDGELDYIKVGALDLEQWYHVVGVYDGETIAVYVNGESKASSDLHSGPILYPPNAFLTIGIYKDDNEHFPHIGMLDEVRLYDRALDEDEVLQNYAAEGLSVSSAGKLSLTWGALKILSER